MSISSIPSVSPLKFWEVFASVVKRNLVDGWEDKYADPTKWTLLMKINLIEIGEELHFRSIHPEYYRIDMGYYSLGSAVHNYYDWDFEVAIEHENNGKSWNYWFDEFVKLAHINCGLRVIITYLGPYQFNRFKNNFSQLINLLQSRKYCKNALEWLIVIGPNWIVEGKSKVRRDFIAYTLENRQLNELTSFSILQQGRNP